MKPNLDQAEMETLQRQLFSKASKLRVELAELTGEKIAMPLTLSGTENLAANIDSLETFCATVEGKIASKKPASAPAVVSQTAQASGASESANLTHKTKLAKERAQESAEVNKNRTQAQMNQKPNTDGAKYTMSGEIGGQPFSAALHPVSKPTLTEKVLEARGCKNLAELGARAAKGEFNDPLD